MVCVANKESRCECIVRDSINNKRFAITLPATTLVREWLNKVATSLKYDVNSFQLVMMNPNGLVITEQTEGSLEDAGLSTEPGQRNNFILEGIGGVQKNLVTVFTNDDDPGISSPPPINSYYHHSPTIRPCASPSTVHNFSSLAKPETGGYVGLVNQAMTCYLNSLLQALFMTPEFRNALYKWQFDASGGTNPTTCIPFQLQKLFLNLQTSSKTAVETTELTKSFGWESGEVWQQHDIQELCRVMFDALEQEFKDTEQANLINLLYQGKMIDYVKCLECGNENSREDTFLDIPLPLRPFGSTVAYESVEEAVKAFVQPETLAGNDQYFCDKCQKKCDAHKGLKFSKFPYLLTLHLKRFDFDYSTMHRIKLNDKLVFPDVLDLNLFINNSGSSASSPDDSTSQDIAIKNDDSSIADSVLEDDSNNINEPQTNEVDPDDDEGIDLSTPSNGENEKPKPKPLTDGPYLYELYSIMIHSGSASGGHYYAYIKDFAKNEWYCFNDQSVTPITQEDIKKTYGGSGGSARGYYSGAYSSSTNAYMLMYRQINKDLNAKAITEEEFPPHIRQLLEELKDAEERERIIRARQEQTFRIKVKATHPVTGQQATHKMFCHNDMTVEEVRSMAYGDLKLQDIVPEEQCRLVTFNITQDDIEESLDGREKETMSEIFKNKFTNNYEFIMDIRDKNFKFLPYNRGDIKLKVYMFNTEHQEVEWVREIRTSPCQTLPELKKLFQEYIPLKTDDVHVILPKVTELQYISDDSLPLNKLGFCTGSHEKIFICYKGSEGDLADKFQDSDLYKLLYEVKNVILLHVVLPDTKKAPLYTIRQLVRLNQMSKETMTSYVELATCFNFLKLAASTFNLLHGYRLETLDKMLIPPLGHEFPCYDDKPSDSTPTGEGVPVVNGVQEEEAWSGVGTSDQSTSEDSSLTDSDRTIMGEASDGPLSSPIDPDQCISPDGNLISKGALLNGPVLENSQVNGESMVWNSPESKQPGCYFRVTRYTTDDGQEMLKVVIDKAMNLNQFKEKLQEYVGVDKKYIKLLRGPDLDDFNTLRICRDDEKITAKLERTLRSDEQRISVNHLVPKECLIQHICDWIVSDGESIASIKKMLLREVEKRASLKIPYERCRLRKQNLRHPGHVLLDSENWVSEGGPSQHVDVFLQELDGPEPITSPSLSLFFARRWNTSTNTIGPLQEIVRDSQPSVSLAKQLSEISGIPEEQVEFAKGRSHFPGEPVQYLNDLYWENDAKSSVHSNDWVLEQGAVIFYRDSKEEMKPLTKEELQSDASQETNSSAPSFSYISNYSSRKEKGLKIYTLSQPLGGK